MTEHQAEVLSPINVAALWPQLHRLGTEIIASRAGDHPFLRAGLAATGVGYLPRVPRTVVIGLRNRLNYRGVLVARRLAGGSAWEVVSLRIARDKDDDGVQSLLQLVATEVAQCGGKTLFLRYAEGTPHEDAIRYGGLTAYTRERLLGPPVSSGQKVRPLRDAGRTDRLAIFRLYCRAVPEVVRRHEAITQYEYRAVLDMYNCRAEYVFEDVSGLLAWAGIGEHEAHMMDGSDDGRGATLALEQIRAHLHPSGTLVLGDHQEREFMLATEYGFTPLGTRVVAARRLAALNPLKEALAAPVTSRVPN